MKTKYLNKGLRFMAGVLGLQGFSYIFDYVVYPPTIFWFGVMWGTFLLFILALILNYLAILIYDKLQTDLFGFEELKKIKSVSAQGKKTFIQKVLSWGDIPAFIVMSWYDPIFAVLYKRKSTAFDGFKKRDYGILILSTAIGCIIWSGVWGPASYFAKKAWIYFFA